MLYRNRGREKITCFKASQSSVLKGKRNYVYFSQRKRAREQFGWRTWEDQVRICGHLEPGHTIVKLTWLSAWLLV